MRAFHVILREHGFLQATDFKARVLAEQLIGPDQAGNFMERRRIFEDLLHIFASGEITEAMLKDPRTEATTPT